VADRVGEKIKEGGDMLWIIGTGLLGVLLLGNLRVASRLGVVCIVIIGAAAVIQYDLTSEPGRQASLLAEQQASPGTNGSATLMAQND
jgi:hypothetical protein